MMLQIKYTKAHTTQEQKKQTTELKKGKILIDMSPEKTNRWPIGT